MWKKEASVCRFPAGPWRLLLDCRWRIPACAILVLSGCGPAAPSLVDVRGSVTFNGKPLPKGQIAFVPEGSGQPGLGYLSSEGTYRLMSGGGRPGILPGTYRVSITAIEGGSFEDETVRYLIPERFRRLETSGLSAEVPADSRGGATFDFSLP